MKLFFNIVLFIVLQGCATEPWRKFPINKTPDKSCWSGSEAGYEVYVWSCYKGERIVVYQWQSSLYTFSAKMETVPCVEKTDFEKKYKITDHPQGICRKKASPWIIEFASKKDDD